MKIKFKEVALLAVLGMAAAGCQKESAVEPVIATDNPVAMRTVYYSIDGECGQVTFLDEHSWKDFLDWMFALAQEGRSVSFREGSALRQSAAKDVVTYTTKVKNEAYAWADIMVKQGYEVSVQYNASTGIYTCTAIK